MNSSTALLLIDFQRDFCAPGGYADQCGGLDWVASILPKAQRLLAAARAAGLTVVHTREGYAPDLSDCDAQKLERFRRAGAEIGSRGPLGRLLVRGEYGHDFIDSLQPVEGEIVVDKATYGSFCRTDLEQQLRARGITTLAICGVTADVCVHTTLREATDRGFACLYVRDAISTFDPDVRAMCERMVLEEGGIWGALTSSDELIAHWECASVSTHLPSLQRSLPMSVELLDLRSLWKPGRTWRDGECFPEMIDLPLGSFGMGEHGEDKFATDIERPNHRVEIAHPIAIGRFPVTVAELAEFTGGAFAEEEATLPASWVSWEEAVAYCEWLSQLTGHGYRLPTEAEWEYACRAGKTTAFPNGDTLSPADANYLYDEQGVKVGAGRRTPVRAYPANAFGLHDMVGNVCEWVSDRWHPTFHAAPAEGESWEADTKGSGLRVIRGGAWDYLPRLLRSAWRDFLDQQTRRDNVGFRVACAALEGAEAS